MENIKKDVLYVQKTLKGSFKTMTAIKITFIPGIAAFCTWVSTNIGGFEWPKWASAIVCMFVSLLVLLFVMARKARTLEECKILILFDEGKSFVTKERLSTARWKTIYKIGVKNTSFNPLCGVESRLASVISLDGTETFYPDLQLSAGNDENSKRIVLNPKDIKYYTLLELIEPVDISEVTNQEFNRAYTLEENNQWPDTHITVAGRRLGKGPYRLEIRVSAEKSPDMSSFFKFWLDDNNKLFFEVDEVVV